MRLWQDGIIALLASIGTATLLWWMVQGLIYVPPRHRGTIVLVAARGDGDELEAQIRALSLMGGERHPVGEILLVDCGLTEEGRTLCRHLARQYRRVTFIPPEDIPKYLT